MDRPDEDRTRLARLLAQVAAREGTHPTPVPGVEVTRRAQGFARKPVAYPPNIIVVGQGRKRGYLGDEVLPLDPFNYLVLSVPIPFECEASASPEEPLLVVTVSVEPALLGELLLEMDEAGPPAGPPPRGSTRAR